MYTSWYATKMHSLILTSEMKLIQFNILFKVNLFASNNIFMLNSHINVHYSDMS